MYENSWRADNCPEGYPEIWCDCPFEESTGECPGAWDCDDIFTITIDWMNAYDNNFDGSVNLEDSIDADELAML